MRLIDAGKMLLGSGVIVLACSSAGGPSGSGMMVAAGGESEAVGGSLGASGGGVSGLGSAGLGTAGLDMVAGASAAQAGAADCGAFGCPAQEITADCTTQGPDTLAANPDNNHNYFLFAVADLPGKTFNQLLGKLGATGIFTTPGYLPGYRFQLVPELKEGSATILCGLRSVVKGGAPVDVITTTDIRFVFNPG